ncbi:DENN domain-containing protein 5A isoform X1 [Bombus bifarius]|uniref:DENN domain-containing protein 5A isoform X1 n=1 Tax=Bombus bifarius TaxID=103933 RepID=A0A6P8LSG4_9HYME|nr:DENN domain-containing protein 5A isoform X1 [Bombus vancouverensis nearcticus]XP_033199836.1 DENN domain-containing protein 5A isoform X1 [Bombus vancouverensis nearcticus]XP_033199837.1 DENN domain-containing protein 5A isoform X1 [Bombus vancouverensis nearcticus]XP_033301213.1 DENN domain-containing protein 5A isoform X1 [Bombus bifarius]XP_033301214.1 DENN domain-containing protein 5A isoform X1 [Bombus bifarius]
MNGSLGIMRGPEQHPQRFADYFVICGLDKDSGLEPDKYFGDSLQCTPLDRAYKSKVLGHYPDSVPWNPFDEHAVCMLCLPSGLRFRTQKHSVEPTFHSFVLTKEDGHRTYGFSLVFYEECRNRKICAAMQTLQAMHITELSSGQNGTPPTARKGQDGHNTRSLPRHFKLSAHSPGAALGYYDSTKDKLLVTKSISLLCQQPYLHAAKTFLTNLYKCVPRHPGPGLSLESYVYNLLYNVPVPLPGKSLKFFIPNDEPAKSPLELVIHQPTPSQELQMLDYPLKDIFTWLGADCVIQLFTCVLLENQVLLRSSDFHKLMVVSECITALLFPFSWQHVYVPILPASLHHFLDAPVPFIMGLHAQSEGGVLKIASEANLCYVDIDKQSSQFPEELPVFPHKMQFIAEIRALLNKYKVPHAGKTDNTVINHYNGDIMTSSLTLPGSGCHLPRRKHSLHDVLDWNRPEPTSQSDTLQRIVDIAKRTGVNVEDIDSVEDNVKEQILSPQEEYQEMLMFNNAIREIFLNRFVQIFSNYEHFVIQPSQDKDEWLNNRDSMHVFDKATFLSDQPTQHLPFLSRFLETQMFASLVDSKVMSTWSELDFNTRVFDQRISLLRKKVGEGIVRSTRYEPCTSIEESQKVLEQRLTNVDFETNPPTEIVPHRAAYFRSFPLLDSVALNKEPTQSILRSRRGQTQWKYKMKSMESNGKTPVPQETQSPRPQTKLSADMSPALIAQANWTFVEKLLKDCKSKTKRMLVEKMGSEAVALGHGGESLSDVEENTLVASLCDLLERVWSHGLQNKQGKSALWSHLAMYQEEECNDPSKPIDPNFLSPAKKSPSSFFGLPERLISSLKGKNIFEIASYIKENFNDLPNLALEIDSPTRGTDKHKSPGDRKIGPEHLRPLPNSLLFDIRNVQAMTDIKTHIGYARAWVRLALEKKLLSRHLKTLLSDTRLLRSQYKRSAFLRCEEEKEQFLYHLLTLNAVDYFCFTNNYPTTKLPYRVVIFPSRKASAATTSANSWIAISGTLCETNPVPIPKGALEFVFHHKNLGVLSTLRIGHDNTGLSPKWMVEHVVVRNEVTGHTFKFPCGRWLGRGIDDGSTERLLVGALVPRNIDSEELVESCSTPPRCRSPSIPRRPIVSQVELQHMLGESVNAIVKFHYRRECQDGSLTALLCGEGGLVPSLEQIFLFGFKNQRIFGKNFYVWDYLLRVKENFEISLLEEMDEYSQRLNRDRRIHAENNQRFTTLRCYCHLIDQINLFSQTLGKDGKFQLFICLAAREQLLHSMLRPMSEARSTADMYEETSFLRNTTLLNFLIHILEPLSEFHIVLEKSLTHGISSIC